MLTKKQNLFYWKLWAAAKVALVKSGLSPKEAEARRHEIHREALGVETSHTIFTNADFDKVKAAFLAIAQPGNMAAQIRQAAMPRERLLRSIDYLCDALGEDRTYAAAITTRMNHGGRIGQPWKDKRVAGFDYAHTKEERIARPELQIEELDESELGKVIVALKKVCRRKWPTKPELLDAINDLCRNQEPDPQAASEAVCKALSCDRLPDLERLGYDALAIVFGALCRLCNVPRSRLPVSHDAEIDQPF
jgi:hypothetical protein